MAFFEQIKDMAKSAAEKTEGIAKSVGEKAETALEIQKLSDALATEQDVIDEHYKKIGAEIYKHYIEVGKAPENLADNFAVVAASMAAMDDINKKIAALKVDKLGDDIPKKTCPACGKEILATSKFCHECGAPVAKEEKKETIGEEIKETIHQTEEVYKQAHEEALATEEYPR